MADMSLTLLCPPTLEERLLDMLLMLPQVAVFTSASTAAHGLSPHRLNATEQVLGRAQVTQIQLLLDSHDKEQVLQTIQREMAGSGIRYWITPISQEGEIA